jgi:hypothetical protein
MTTTTAEGLFVDKIPIFLISSIAELMARYCFWRFYDTIADHDER